MPDAARLRIALADLDPAPWREIEVPLSMTLTGLHDTIQAAFLWDDMHLWEFRLDDRRYGPSTDDDFGDFGGERVYKAGVARLKKLRDANIRAFAYMYDFGDGWEHRIEVVDVFDAPAGARLPRLVAGQWRTPPEDIGGPPGFEAFLEAIRDPEHPQHAELTEWHGGPFDPVDIEEEIVRIQLGRLANMRARKR